MAPPMKPIHKATLVVIVAGFAFWTAGHLATVWTEYLWFQALGYAAVFAKAFWSKTWLGVGAFVVIAGWLLGHTALASRLSPGRRLVLANVHPWLTPPNVKRLLGGVAVLALGAFSLALARGYANDWYLVQQFLNRTAFGWADPIFQHDASFYVFVLPVLEKVHRLLVLLALTGLATAAAAYFVGGAFGVQYVRLTRAATRHLAALGAMLALVIAWGYWLRPYGMLLEADGAVYGVGWVDHHVRVPACRLMAVAAAAAAVLVLAAGIVQKRRPAILGAVLVAGMHVAALWIAPALVQAVKVRPNELDLEAGYIAWNMEATRRAFGLDRAQVIEFIGTRDLAAADLEAAPGTIENIRLWDWRVLQDIYRELQGLRTYYAFNPPDVDRYRLDGQYRQVSVAVRELYADELDPRSLTWVNEHLVYTHGYGLVMTPTSSVGPQGTPEVWIGQIPPAVSPGVPLRLARPGIYFGERGRKAVRGRRAERRHTYVFVRTTESEFDYPLGDSNQMTRYEGKAGVAVHSLARRLLFAYYFGDGNILLTEAFTDETRVLWRRDLQDMLPHLVPFLHLDGDPYPVLHRGGIVWIVDAYTTTARYPYSARFGHADLRLLDRDEAPNYIRNSVKITVDAYDGTVTFYVADPQDPLLETARKIFPAMFRPLGEMPPDLRAHLRYPLDLFNIQAERYMAYHVTDPKVFYNQEDLWQRPQEVYGETRVPVVAYYIIMTLPGQAGPEYLLMLPFTPQRKNNMVGWMAARCDGTDPRRLLVYRFPKGATVQGPSQIEAKIEQNEDISRELTLWNQMGSSVTRGNLLVIPVKDSLLYVEPLYLRSTQTPLPELKRVIVATKDRIAMRGTLAEALAAVFGQAPPALPPVPTPGPGPPRPGPAPGPAEDFKALAAEAERLYTDAQRQQRAGDWAAYGQTMERLGEVLRKLAERSPEPPSPEPPRP